MNCNYSADGNYTCRRIEKVVEHMSTLGDVIVTSNTPSSTGFGGVDKITIELYGIPSMFATATKNKGTPINLNRLFDNYKINISIDGSTTRNDILFTNAFPTDQFGNGGDDRISTQIIEKGIIKKVTCFKNVYYNITYLTPKATSPGRITSSTITEQNVLLTPTNITSTIIEFMRQKILEMNEFVPRLRNYKTRNSRNQLIPYTMNQINADAEFINYRNLVVNPTKTANQLRTNEIMKNLEPKALIPSLLSYNTIGTTDIISYTTDKNPFVFPTPPQINNIYELLQSKSLCLFDNTSTWILSMNNTFNGNIDSTYNNNTSYSMKKITTLTDIRDMSLYNSNIFYSKQQNLFKINKNNITPSRVNPPTTTSIDTNYDIESITNICNNDNIVCYINSNGNIIYINTITSVPVWSVITNPTGYKIVKIACSSNYIIAIDSDGYILYKFFNEIDMSPSNPNVCRLIEIGKDNELFRLNINNINISVDNNILVIANNNNIKMANIINTNSSLSLSAFITFDSVENIVESELTSISFSNGFLCIIVGKQLRICHINNKNWITIPLHGQVKFPLQKVSLDAINNNYDPSLPFY